jgi:hypothetical protein
MALKQSIKQYRNIAGKYYIMYTSNPADFENYKAECKNEGLSYKIINNQFYKEFRNEND